MNFTVIDTETTNGFDSPLVYDVGWSVVDEKGDVKRCRSFVVEEIFYCKELMAEAFFKDKIPQYEKDIADGKRTVLPLMKIRSMLKADCSDFSVMGLVAHNAKFDYTALSTTIRYITTSRCRFFLPFGIELYDTLKMARSTYWQIDDYCRFCYDNGYITEKTAQPKLTAEVIYRYLNRDNGFAEEHTALEDTLIEKDILADCLARGAVLEPCFERQFVEIFNGKENYYVEMRDAIIGTEIDGRKIIFREDEIPDGAWVVAKWGYYKKGAEKVA